MGKEGDGKSKRSAISKGGKSKGGKSKGGKVKEEQEEEHECKQEQEEEQEQGEWPIQEAEGSWYSIERLATGDWEVQQGGKEGKGGEEGKGRIIRGSIGTRWARKASAAATSSIRSTSSSSRQEQLEAAYSKIWTVFHHMGKLMRIKEEELIQQTKELGDKISSRERSIRTREETCHKNLDYYEAALQRCWAERGELEIRKMEQQKVNQELAELTKLRKDTEAGELEGAWEEVEDLVEEWGVSEKWLGLMSQNALKTLIGEEGEKWRREPKRHKGSQ